jgi:hypothetical protein
LGVTLSIARRAALMKPVCSATPRPSIATSTTPSGGKFTKVLTISAVKPVRLAPASRFLTWIGWPLRGSSSANCTFDSSADTIQTTSINPRNSSAGSGSRLPMRSTASRKRTRKLRLGAAV